MVEKRVAALEADAEVVRARLARLEARWAESPAAPPGRARGAGPWARSGPALSPLGNPRVAGAAAPRAPADLARLEDLVGGRVLAWVGGVALFAGVACLLAVAITRGWIGEEARTVLAGVASLVLAGGGARAYERRGRTDAALAAVAAGIAGLFATIVVAAQVYGLVPALAGVAGAIGVGGIATWLAVRWDAAGIGALGITGALAAPVLVGAFADPGALLLLWIATASATAALAWRRWTWLAFATFLITAPQWIGRLASGEAGVAEVLALAGGFGLLAALAAVAFELRTRATAMRPWSCVLLTANALVCAAAGWSALQWLGADGAADAWLVGLAAAHAVGGLLARRRTSAAFGRVLLVLGVLLCDLAFAALVDGTGLAVGWALSAIGFAALHRAGGGRLAELGLGAHIALALGQALVLDLGGATGALPIALAGVAAGCFAAGQVLAPRRAQTAGGGPDGPDGDMATGRAPRPAGDPPAPGRLAGAAGPPATGRARRPVGDPPTPDRLAEAAGRLPWAPLLNALGLATLLAMWASALDGLALALVCSGQALALTGVARRSDDPVAAGGALGFLAASAACTLAELAPPEALAGGLPSLAAGAAALGALTIGTAACAHRLPRLHRAARVALAGAAAVVVLYTSSTALVTAAGAGDDAQALLSGLWAVTGVATLVAGLVRDVRVLRLGALALLALTAGKVFVLDLAALESLYRAASFGALGALLLLASFAWQRMRPRRLPDLRSANTSS
jgi:uncharacterized membrane protein